MGKRIFLKHLTPHLLLLCACWMMACPKAGLTPGAQTHGPITRGFEAAGLVHVVAKGDTCYGIAKHYRVPLAELLAANHLRASDTLHIGQRLLIPQISSEASETKLAPQAVPDATGFKLAWPLKGMLYAKFGKKGKEVHDGVDLAAPLGTPVKVAAAGKVIYAGEQKGYGKIVIVEHAVGVVTLYAHNHELRAQTGELVAAGAVIATVGQSGRTSGPHLHFELRKNGIPVDPLPYFNATP